MKVATAAYPIDWHESWQAYAHKLERWVSEAQTGGAELLVFPEYGLMEVASLAGELGGDYQKQAQAVADRFDEAEALHAELARAHGLHILMASGPAWSGHDLVNRAALISPTGVSVHQDKQIMTRWERDPWGIVSGGPLRVFETQLVRIGVLICYDSEFPLLARRLVEAEVEVILVPSCTEALEGYWRVRIGAMARALEGQCVTVMSSLVGDVPWCEPVEQNTGMGGVFGPPDMGFPATGVLAEGALNKAGWTYADVNLEAIRLVRADGHVLNRLHWSEQNGALEKVETCRLP